MPAVGSILVARNNSIHRYYSRYLYALSKHGRPPIPYTCSSCCWPQIRLQDSQGGRERTKETLHARLYTDRLPVFVFFKTLASPQSADSATVLIR